MSQYVTVDDDSTDDKQCFVCQGGDFVPESGCPGCGRDGETQRVDTTGAHLTVTVADGGEQ
jgi:hypothetical protein